MEKLLILNIKYTKSKTSQIMEQIKELNEWKKALDASVLEIEQSVVAFRAELEKLGASEQFIKTALCHEYEMLEKIHSETSLYLQTETYRSTKNIS